jgi:hypothetical protein
MPDGAANSLFGSQPELPTMFPLTRFLDLMSAFFYLWINPALTSSFTGSLPIAWLSLSGLASYLLASWLSFKYLVLSKMLFKSGSNFSVLEPIPKCISLFVLPKLEAVRLIFFAFLKVLIEGYLPAETRTSAYIKLLTPLLLCWWSFIKILASWG